MWHVMQLLVGAFLTNVCWIGCPGSRTGSFFQTSAGGSVFADGLTVGSLLKLSPPLPNFDHIALCTGLRSFAYTTWQALQPEAR
jgi:hypothetical protein